jgi:hypothetical protein
MRNGGLEGATLSAAKAIQAARSAGVGLGVRGVDTLKLEAAAAPPAEVLALLARHKTEILSLLRPGRDGWNLEDRRGIRPR